MRKRQPLKLLVIGIDGASHNVLQRMLDKAMLPNFARIKTQSASGVLKSTFPPHTAPGWASMFTGVEPGEHGIFQFWDTKSRNYSARSMNSSDYSREPIWHTLERHGLKVGVYNVPMTHPPAPLENGYMISWPLSTTLHYTEPKSLKNELLEQGLHYHSDIVTMYRGQEDYCEQAARFIQGRAETCLYLQESRPVDAMFVVFTEIDRISHYYWGEEEYPSATVERAYMNMDMALSTLMELVDENTLLIVASDHGFGLCKADFNVHEALEQEGLLKTSYVPVRNDQLKSGHDDTSLKSWFESPFAYRRVIDWESTSFYMPTPGCFGLNINLKGRESQGLVEPEQVPECMQRLRNALSKFLYEGQPCFDVLLAQEVYRGVAVENAPDIILVPGSFGIMPTPNLAGEIWSRPSQDGVHRPDGILYVQGSTFNAGESLFARIEDVYPTILAHLNLPVAESIEGHWLKEPEKEVVREQFLKNRHGRQLTQQETECMDKQLHEIGYC